MITANSFMKREFGKALIERFLPQADLDLVVNTSGAYIPGHGTPTVLLFGSSSPPTQEMVASVLAKRGEPSTPLDPERGLVWSSIAAHWSDVGHDDDYITVIMSRRESLSKHPWSLGGGGAAELKELLEERAALRLADVVETIGFGVITGEDNVMLLPADVLERHRVQRAHQRRLVIGEEVRDWSIGDGEWAIWPCRAGWNHLQQAQALAALYQARKQESWTAERLTPMLAGLLELLPWLKQWHNEPSAEFDGLKLGDYFEGYLDEQCAELGLTRDALRAWRPAAKTRGAAGKGKTRTRKPKPDTKAQDH